MKNDGFTLAVLGCGTMGNAILGGIFASLNQIDGLASETQTQQRLPTRFIATVRRPEGGARIRKELGHYPQSANLTIYENETARAIQDSDVILLACAPDKPATILQQDGVRDALSGKLLVHILAGVSTKDIRKVIYGDVATNHSQCTIVKAMPNAAAAVRQSMTVIAASEPALSPEHDALVKWIFNQIGRVVVLDEAHMDIATVLGGATPAMMASLIEGIAQGGIELGTPMRESYEMAAQAMIGAATLVLQGAHPAQVRDGCSCPGGCTAKSLAVIEEGAVRGTLARAVREGVVVAKKLGSKKD